MLYDNAQLALAYLHGHLLCKSGTLEQTANLPCEGKRLAPAFRQVCEETLDFIAREMTHPQGGFYSSLDADSEGEEGKYYTWSLAEIQATLPDPADAALLTAAYGLTQAGNFEGKNILQRLLDDEQIAEQFTLPVQEVPAKLAGLHKLLLAARSQRVRPGTDDKVLTFWNALALTAFAEAGRYFGRPDYIILAIRNAHFLLDNLYPEGRLLRSWRNGQAQHSAYLEDYAGLILALLALYQSDPDPYWYTTALKLADEMVAHYADPNGGFFDTRDDHETLLLRPKDLQDNATPSGNALAAAALLQLAAYGDRGPWRSLAEIMLAALHSAMTRYPTAFAQWLCAADFAAGPAYEVALLGSPEDPGRAALLRALWAAYRPRMVAAIAPYPPEPGSPALLQDRPLQNNRPTAYVCQGFVCRQPVNAPAELLAQLGG